jgi:hypothetical protein
MAPSTGHERFKKVAGRFVETMAEESAVQNRMNIFTLIILRRFGGKSDWT